MQRWTWFAVIILSAWVTGCKEKPQADPQLDSYLAGAKRKLAKVDALKAAAAAAPRLTADTFALPAKGPFTILSTDQLKTNLGNCFDGAMVCRDEWWVLSGCKAVAGKPREAIIEQWDGTRRLKECSELRYLAVVRKTAFSEPVVSLAEQKFQGGELDGDVFVFEIDSGKSLGGFRVKGTTPTDFKSREVVERVLKDQLMSMIGEDIFLSIQKRMGGK